ncbi:vanillyl alcohol oxidase [Canariomyces notabilis]|uniref:Vanillyl alcohol oxidase n=1 Tax=Canariomyces notabilis TaxID=2074819 RepID=A0AAN6TEE1_9PEZI|nr:vanillyl alcohol oxidase [Canariomyces arenarius]
MSFAAEAHSDVPTLPSAHSGIPAYLLEKARKEKEVIFETRTKPQNERQRLPVVPQGIERDEFLKALAELKEQLGQENVEINDKPLKDGWYMEHPNTHDMMTILDEEEFVASAIVYPGSTEEVQQIVLWANKYRIPIFPISMGRNLGYGGAAPRVRGSVTIDLGKRMNKILDINAEDYTCLVEPGVSFYALYEAIKERGLEDHMWIDTPDLGGGSIIGNTVDRGVGYTPYGDHWACHSGLEVVLPTGEVIRTGMGALPGNNTWQAFPYGFGPFSDGIFSQSNFGIVTKMGMTLMPNPGGHEAFMYTFPKEEDLAPLIDIIRPLRISNILENVAQLRHVTQALAARGRPRTEFYSGSGPMPSEAVHAAAAKTPVGDHAWAYYGMSYGPPQVRAHKLALVDAAFRRIPGARRIDPSTLPADEYFWARDRVARGVPDIHELRWVNWQPNGAHIAFSPVSPIRGADAARLFALGKEAHERYGIDFFPAFCVGLREMHLIVEIVFDRADAGQRKAALACLRDMVDEAAKLGYGEYRTHLVLMDQVAGTYNWNDGALMKFNERLKDALDPQGILAPGRCGIWPKRYRGRGWEMTRDSGERSEGNGVDLA